MHAMDAKTQKIEPDTNFLGDESFRGSVQTWLTQREVVFIFQRAKISDLVYRGLHCAMAFRVKSTNRSNRIKIESASVRGSNKDVLAVS